MEKRGEVEGVSFWRSEYCRSAIHLPDVAQAHHPCMWGSSLIGHSRHQFSLTSDRIERWLAATVIVAIDHVLERPDITVLEPSELPKHDG